RERLDAAQLDGAQVHRGRTLTTATDGDGSVRSGGGRVHAERRERLGRGLLLGRLLRRAATGAQPLAVDQGRADEPALVRRALDLEDLVLHRAAGARERLLELRLRVDMARARVLDPVVEGFD